MIPDRFVWFLAISVLLVLTAVAFCSDVMKVAEAHDWYTGLILRRPGKADVNCCGGQDCAPYEYRRSPGGLAIEALMPDGSWLRIPPDLILPMGPESDIDRVHVCCFSGHCKSSSSHIRCAIVPGFGA